MALTDLSAFEGELGVGDIRKSMDADKRPCVLVIDDDAHMRASLELILESRHRVLTASNADDGVALLTDDVATVILDIKMAGKDGFEAYTLLRQKDEDVPIIFHSAYQDVKDPYEIMNRYRPFGYITKGSVAELLHSIEAAIAFRSRLLRQKKLASSIAQIQMQLGT
jgi:DNA-binding NtrC family response regulator